MDNELLVACLCLIQLGDKITLIGIVLWQNLTIMHEKKMKKINHLLKN